MSANLKKSLLLGAFAVAFIAIGTVGLKSVSAKKEAALVATQEVTPKDDVKPDSDEMKDEKPETEEKSETQDAPKDSTKDEAANATTTKTPAIFDNTITYGDPKAAIIVDEYASLSCGHCAAFYKSTFQELKKSYIDTGKVFLRYHHFPLNAPALHGALAVSCLPENEARQKFLGFLFDTQEKWAFEQNYMDILAQNAKLIGLTEGQFKGCVDNEDAAKKVLSDLEDAQKTHKIDSTPTFVINGGKTIIKGVQPISEFEKAFGIPVSTPQTNENAPAAGTNLMNY
jgi:protein-disulfide isomerase